MANELERYRCTIFALLKMRDATHELIMSFVEDWADIYINAASDEECAIAVERVRCEMQTLPDDLSAEVEKLFFQGTF